MKHMKKILFCTCMMAMLGIFAACGDSDMNDATGGSQNPVSDEDSTVPDQNDQNGQKDQNKTDGNGSVIQDVGDGVGDVMDGVGKGVDDVADGVGEGVEDVGRGVEDLTDGSN